MKYKLLLLVAILFIYASSCNDDEPIEPFDHAAQALKDNDSLVKYMQEHFLDEEGVLQEIENDELAIFDDANLKVEIVPLTRDEEEINYKLYYYIQTEGVGEKPTRIDRANVSYKGMDLDGDVFDQNAPGLWRDLFSIFEVIPGWRYGIPNFNAGDVPINNGDGTFTYTGQGKGMLFIPSGLAYANTGKGSIAANTPLIFYITLNEIFRTDHDEDNVLSMFEDVDGDGKYDDDTDEDGIPNYADTDDDGDGTLTKNEDFEPDSDLEYDADGDGDPTNDIGDGDPTNDDTNENGIPDYLDPDVS